MSTRRLTKAEQYPEFLCQYPFGREGKKWCVSVWAKDRDEAEARLRAIGAYGTVDGELVARIPAYPGVGLGLRVIAALRNRLVRLREGWGGLT